MKKFLLFAVLFLFTMIVAVAIFLDTLAGRALETLGTKALGTEVQVGFVHVSLVNGPSSIHNLVIQNPPGYPKGVALSVKKIVFRLSLLSILSPLITIHEIEIDHARIYYIGGGAHGSNLGALGHLSGKQFPPTVSKGAYQKKIEIGTVIIRDMQVSGETALGRATLKIPFVQVNHIGAPSGTTPDAAFKTIFTAVLKAVPSQFPVYSAADVVSNKLDQWGSELHHLFH